MALDPGFLLSQLPSSSAPPISLRAIPELARTIHRNANRIWGFQINNDHCLLLDGSHLPISDPACRQLSTLLRGRWIVLDHCPLDAIDNALLSLQHSGGNGYLNLLAAGAVAVAPSANARLSGGSFADVQLCLAGDRVGVRKIIKEVQHRSSTDAGHRLLQEMEWIASLPASAASLFPRLISTTESALAVGYVTEFLPGYSLAENIIDGRSTLAEARQAITSLLTTLVMRLYCTLPSEASLAAVRNTYLRKIRRRTAMIEASSHNVGRVLKDLMAAETVYVNGFPCVGLPVLLDALTPELLAPHVQIRARERAHGDLILDDIILLREGEARLVDPSGEGYSRLYDLGKLCLSLTTCYEFFKYDLFDCAVDASGSVPRVTVAPRRHPARQTFSQLSELLPEMLAHSGFLENDNHKLTGTGLVLLSGMQNLALPMFHLIHHRREMRAVAFFAIGLLRITQGLTDISSRRSVTLDDACRCIF